MTRLLQPLLIVIAISLAVIHCAVGQNSGEIRPIEYQYPKSDQDVVRILTYNVRNCKGMDDKTDYQRVASVILAINPEVVALQELDSATLRSHGVDVLKVIAQKCGMKYTYGASIPYLGGKYGIGILSKDTPLKSFFFSLPGKEEKRGLLMAEFENYVFFCSHFSLTQADGGLSVQIINQKAKEFKKRVILAGDLNGSPESEATKSLSENWINLSGTWPTFPSKDPKECIDYIWGTRCCNYSYDITKQEVVPERVSSDHLPVFVDVKFK
jgi:endonuclease/exonuclease/phosphatase family metal-dependent hydrolase